MNQLSDNDAARKAPVAEAWSALESALERWRPVLPSFILALTLAGFAVARVGLPAVASATGDKRTPVLYLAGQDPCDLRFEAVSQSTACAEPHLVIVTHGWYEQQPWPAEIARAIRERVDGKEWRCGWYDWRQKARRLFPSDAAQVARDEAGPLLGRQIVGLSQHWRHVHLIGHSAGAWVVNEAAQTVAQRSSARIHLTFLDAYVPQGWDPNALGVAPAGARHVYWAEHYFTRGRVEHLTENILAHAHNVDITDINPGFDSHNFPRHWYYATVLDRYDTRKKKLAGAKVTHEVDGVLYGYLRAREADPDCWELSVTLRTGAPPVRMAPRP